MRAIAAVSIILISATVSVLGQWRDPQTGKPVEETEWRKSVKGLGAELVLIDDEEAFLKEWETPESHVATVKSASKMKRGAVLSAELLFFGCGRPKGNCDATADFTVLKPDGSVYGNIRGAIAWSGPAPKPEIVVLSSAHLRMLIDPAGQLGEYTVRGTLREAHGSRQVKLTRRFDVVE